MYECKIIFKFTHSPFFIFIELFSPDKWGSINGAEYMFSSVTSNWHHARKYCRANGGDLAVPTNSQINNKICLTMKQLYIRAVWIGVYKDNNDTFTTVRGSLLYSNWRPNEPNNKGGAEGCVELISKTQFNEDDNADGGWNNESCWSGGRYYLCERHFTATHAKNGELQYSVNYFM